ncbi:MULTISPECIES: enoyl-CoA hydratase/isomerase family protein [unclassified Halomonas]|uniref:enoyl-CoA hydratase/isomerase family protein n=1 Tax=unclassified Halomonas TaxID=2609666 RepID=UPI0020A1B873|nr:MULTISPECIES: enoyl-CoA hydratase/isomerase family protein [unclassified Halomonas]MCP1314097.1 enoyl-CoA hydratase/isomerase family protein [Halomonas sp. 707D7]MCP1326554.1 enoyl-CoA hydratase/isomerase family protein [Halomonas sp. 707D4]
MNHSTLTIERGVARLSLNRPAVHNAFDDHLIAELTEHLKGLLEPIERQEVRVLLLASEGKSFSAGADLNWMKRMVDYDHDANLADSRKLSELMHRLDTLPCPTLCRVQGAAFGGAVGLAACCDVVVASSRAKFCLSEVRIGLSPAVISPYVQRAIGARQMRRYALTAEVIDADTAQTLGLVHQVVEPDGLDEAIEAMTQTLLKGSPRAQRATKALLAAVGQSPDSDATRERTCQTIATLRASPEGQEGLASFFDKRLPAWAPLDDTDHAGERP